MKGFDTDSLIFEINDQICKGFVFLDKSFEEAVNKVNSITIKDCNYLNHFINAKKEFLSALNKVIEARMGIVESRLGTLRDVDEDGQ